MSRKIVRNMSTPEARAFWESCEKTAAEVSTWPDWKRAGINVAQQRSEPRIRHEEQDQEDAPHHP